MKHFLIGSGLVFLFFFSVSAQKVRVIDKSDLQPVENVEIIGRNYSTTTDKSGSFDLSRFDPDEPLTIRHVAYQGVIITKKEIITAGDKMMLSGNVIMLGEVVLSANKILENKSDVPQKIDVISNRQISFNNPQTSGDLLQQTGNVFIQQSQMGGSSPVLRGFEANKVLLVVDGVRMNNAIYRSGHLQSVITIDPNMIDRVELVYGPGSVIYGSDAIGGVMAFYSKSPVLSGSDESKVTVGGMSRFSSANLEKAGNVYVNFGKKKWASLTSVSYKSLGDLREGKNRSDDYPDWGKCFYFSHRFKGRDSMMVNSKPWIQKRSGYIQYDLMHKIMFVPTENARFFLNFQFSNSGNIPRYDRLAEMDPATGFLKYADWYYGPQTRFLGSARAELKSEHGLYDHSSLTAAYQNISEDRISRRFNKTAESHQEETVEVYSFNFDLMKQLGVKSELRYGLEAVYNEVGSLAYNYNVSNSTISFDNPSRYPDAGNRYSTIGAYATHNYEAGKKLIFSQGIRFSTVSLNSEYSDAMMKITKFPFDKQIEQHSSAVNGNLGMVYMPGNDWRFTLMGSSAFRAPNVDDVGKVNDSKAGSLVVLPNPDLKPEHAWNSEFTVGKIFHNIFRIEFTGFYTRLKEAIVVQSSQFNGQSTIIWNGVPTAVQRATNAGNAYVTGFQSYLMWKVAENVFLNSTLSYTYGRLKKGNEPLDHIPPLFGLTSLKYSRGKFRGEFYTRYNGWKHLKDYSLSGEDNLPQATPDGMPSWLTLNFRTEWQFNNMLKVQVGMENMLDRHYRYFASGISAPGRNLIVALRVDM